jgi:DNA-binding GntR family transcriptional regulator
MPSPAEFSGSSIERTTLADKVYETLLEAIVSGRLSPGTELSVVGLAKELDVSRTPVHDALRQLAYDGLVDQEVNRKARVSSFNRDDVFEVFEMRKLLEGRAAELAASRMDARTLACLRGTANQLAASSLAVDWQQRWIEYDEEFHDRIAHASGNRRLWIDISRYRLMHRGFNQIATNVDCLQTALDEHQEILSALEERNGGEAASAMVSHIETWQVFFVKNFPR